jgi:hypothetical protein
MYSVQTLSRDGTMLAAMVYPDNSDMLDASLVLVDLSTWQHQTLVRSFDGSAYALSFSPDGSVLALASESPSGWPPEYSLRLIEAETGELLHAAGLPAVPRRVAFSADGELLTVYGAAPILEPLEPSEPPSVAIFDAASLEPRATIALEGVVDGILPVEAEDLPEPYRSISPGVAFSPDGRMLYVVHADEERLTLVDLTRRTVRSMQITPGRSWIERLLAGGTTAAQAKGMGGAYRSSVVSADGARIFTVGTDNEVTVDDSGSLAWTSTSLGLQVLDSTTGVEIIRLETEASEIALHRDGSRLMLYGWGSSNPWPWTEAVDAGLLDRVGFFDRQRLAMAHDSDGRWFYVGVSGPNAKPVVVLDAQSGETLASWALYSNWAEVISLP